jgi:hypothetical protein
VAKQILYLLAADAILLIHALFVVFVVLGLILIFIGGHFHWSWVRNIWFRLSHLAAIVVVVLQSWVGAICPLTLWEMELRERTGDAAYSGSFIAHWVESLLYYRAPAWVFVVCYSIFGALVLVGWLLVRPNGASR